MEIDESVQQTNPRKEKDSHSKKPRKRKKLLYNIVRQQMEFYFSDANLTKDRFLKQLLTNDPYVPLSTFLTFNKIKQLVNSVDDIERAITSSEKLKLSPDNKKVCRIGKIDDNRNVDDCTIYVEALPTTATHDWIRKIFEIYGPVAYVSLPKFRLSHQIKEFAFIEYESKASVIKAINAFKEIGGLLNMESDPDKLFSVTSYLKEQQQQDGGDNFDLGGGAGEGDGGNISGSDIADHKITKNKKKNNNKSALANEPGQQVAQVVIVASSSTGKRSSDTNYDIAVKRTKYNTDNEDCSVDRIDKGGKNKDEHNAESTIIEKITNKIDENDAGDDDDDDDNEDEEPQIDDENKNTEDIGRKKVRRKKTTAKNYQNKLLMLSDDNQNLQMLNYLRITTKIEWKRLRNKYLNHQREQIKEMKTQLWIERKRQQQQQQQQQQQLQLNASLTTTSGKSPQPSTSVQQAAAITSAITSTINTATVSSPSKLSSSHKIKQKSDKSITTSTRTLRNPRKINFYGAIKETKDDEEIVSDNSLIMSPPPIPTSSSSSSQLQQPKAQSPSSAVSSTTSLTPPPPPPSPLQPSQPSDVLIKKPLFNYEPGVIVKVHFDEPCVDIKDFKGEMRQYQFVKYIDVKEGDLAAFVRVDQSKSAPTLIKHCAPRKCQILTGQNEESYWEKIKIDREQKITKSLKIKPKRGREKIINKIISSHVRFDD